MQKMQSFSEDGKVLRKRTNSAKLKERYAFKNNAMSTETQNFIQKICYRKSASIDMTQHGFINDSKVNPVNYVMKPLRAQLEKICVKPLVVKRHYSPVLLRAKPSEAVASTEQKLPCIPKSALSCPGTRSSRNRCRVRIQTEPNAGPEAGQKKVKLVSPNKKKRQARTPIKKKITRLF